MKKDAVKKEAEPILADIAAHDPKPTVRAAAIGLLGNYNNPEYKKLFIKNINDSSYTVSGTALEALLKLDSTAAFAEAKKLSKTPAKGKLVESVAKVLIKSGDENGFES